MDKNVINSIKNISKILKSSKNAVFFGGAGVSTDSGIPDFRGPNGLYSRGNRSSEYLLSRSCFINEPEIFFDFYKKNMLYADVLPNYTHKALAYLEKENIIKTVITQNIDGLHQKAGSRNVIELHGSVARNHCVKCGKAFSQMYIKNSIKVPFCDSCGGIVKPDVTLYGECLDQDSFNRAEAAIYNADVLLIGGSSLTVYPAASLTESYSGYHFIIVNLTETSYDRRAEYIIREPISDVFKTILGNKSLTNITCNIEEKGV